MSKKIIDAKGGKRRIMNTQRIRLAALPLVAALLMPTVTAAQQREQLPDYIPVLASVKVRALAVDPNKGYLVKQVKLGVYVVTEGLYQSAFVTTGSGVIVFDAPPSFAAKLPQAIAEVTNEPIKMLVYSHSHLDHISGAGSLTNQAKGLTILAEEETANFLREKNDPRRPVPTKTFKDRYTIKMGSMVVELKKGRWHSPEGDLFFYIPSRKFLMAIDTLAAGHVPFMDFDLSMNLHQYLKVFDELLAYDFDVLVPGHLTYLADRSDVQMTKDYTQDVYKTVKRIHDGTDQLAVFSKAAEKYTWDNKFALFRTLLDGVMGQCAVEIQSRWADKLAGVDVFGTSHCRAALIYARWDD
jgi:glyoxylase-like metal-dependent hydrolase (beta-lactamase superfamily II)